MKEGIEALYIRDVMMMSSKSPMAKIEAAFICTKNYFFLIPISSEAHFVVFSRYKTYDQQQSSEDTLDSSMSFREKIDYVINQASTTEELEEGFKEFLNHDEKYVYYLPDAPKFKIKTVFGKTTAQVRRARMNWVNVMPYSKDLGKQLKAFYGK